MTAAGLLARVARVKPNSRKIPIKLAIGRLDLPTIFRDLGYRRGVEIGVWRGAYSAAFMAANPMLDLLSVDPWLSYPAWQDTKNSLPPEEQVAFMATAHSQALERLVPLGCRILRDFSVDASRTVEDRSLDFVYIDANHVETAVREDLEAWAPKVRRGGIVAGHDYRVFKNKPTIHVVEAVRAYTLAHAVTPWYITAGDRTPSFLWVAA